MRLIKIILLIVLLASGHVWASDNVPQYNRALNKGLRIIQEQFGSGGETTQVDTTGITSLGGLTGVTQTFGNDTNVTITSAGTEHTLGWSGTLARTRGGFGAAVSFGVGSPLLGNGTGAIFASSSPSFGQLNATTTATSTIYGGLWSEAGSLKVQNGLHIADGSLLNTSTATSTFSGGLVTTSVIGSGQGRFDGWVSSGSTTPAASLAVDGSGASNLLLIASSTRTAFSINGNGFIGIGGTTTPGAALSIVGSAFAQEHKLTAASAVGIDWSKGNQQKITLTSATTISFSNGRDGGAYRLVACQDSTGGRFITWPATSTLSWQGRVSPPASTVIADKCDVYSFVVTSGTSSLMYFGVGALSF